jgi:hypothetical protein
VSNTRRLSDARLRSDRASTSSRPHPSPPHFDSSSCLKTRDQSPLRGATKRLSAFEASSAASLASKTQHCCQKNLSSAGPPAASLDSVLSAASSQQEDVNSTSSAAQPAYHLSRTSRHEQQANKNGELIHKSRSDTHPPHNHSRQLEHSRTASLPLFGTHEANKVKGGHHTKVMTSHVRLPPLCDSQRSIRARSVGGSDSRDGTPT